MNREALIPEKLERWSRNAPAAVALTAAERELTYRQLFEAVSDGALALRSCGVSAGDRVLLVGHNTCEWALAYLAALRLGAIIVPINSRLSTRQLRELAELIAPRLLLADAAHQHLLAECREFTCLRLEQDTDEGWLCGARGPSKLPPMPAEDAPAIISFTSGTTGTPKGAVLNQAALAAASRIICETIGLRATDSTLIVAPLFHNTGFVDQLGAMLHVGGRCDLLRVFHTRDAVDSFRYRPVTYITAVPSVLRLLMTTENAEAVYGPAQKVLFGGSPMPAAWSTELLARWPHLKLYHGYGLTEFGSACAVLPPEYIQEHGESVGYPPAGVTLRIVGEDKRDVPVGEIGEIWVAGPTRMKEYWRRPDATAQKLEGEWLRTGDLARIGEHGLIYIVGRGDDTINRGGEKILPQFVESALAERADVAQCTVFAVPHPILQQAVIAAVEPRPGHQFDAVAASKHLRERIPDYAIPEDYFVDHELPRTGSGKIDRKATRALYLARTAAKAETQRSAR